MTTILQVDSILKEYEGRPVLQGATFQLSEGERVGLVGANGSGKSTLLKILTGVETADGGSITWVKAGLTCTYLAQEGHWDPAMPLGDQVGTIPAELLSRCGVDRSLLAQPAGTLSGGQKTRAALARVLASKPRLLLLDEPTNHLDTAGLQWLEELLAKYRGTVLVVSHDRYFLDRVVTRVLELDGGKLKEYPGNYSSYARQKRAEREQAEADYRSYVKEKKRLDAAARRQREWATAAQNQEIPDDAPPGIEVYFGAQAAAHARVAKTIEQRLEAIRVEKPRDAAHVNLRIDAGARIGRNLVLAEDLGFTYDGSRWLFRHASFYLQRGDRAAIVGPNGAGKSTLIRLLLGQLGPTEGSIHCAPVKVAYLAQEMENLNPTNTVLAEAAGGNTALDQPYVRSILGSLLFSGEAVQKPVRVLSGGEKVRLALVKILLSEPDLLVLDEPTNGLDLPSRERVEDALDSYAGTVLLVSHDRYLLRRIATRIIGLEGGRLECFTGGYEQYVQRSEPDDRADRQLILETRLARLSAALASPPAGEAEQLTAEFIQVSRELRELKAK